MRPRNQIIVGICFLTAWTVVEAGFLFGYISGGETLRHLIIGTVVCAFGVATAISFIRRGRSRSKKK